MDRGASQKYLTQQVMLASPANLVAMLYERAITLLQEAVEAIEAGDTQRRWQATNKATEIVAELWQALDMERGGEIAENLNRLYGFMIMRLTMVDTENNAQAAREVIRLLEPLGQAWHELANGNKQKIERHETSDNKTPTQISISA
jgi:flagellar protein FliS